MPYHFDDFTRQTAGNFVAPSVDTGVYVEDDLGEIPPMPPYGRPDSRASRCASRAAGMIDRGELHPRNRSALSWPIASHGPGGCPSWGQRRGPFAAPVVAGGRRPGQYRRVPPPQPQPHPYSAPPSAPNWLPGFIPMGFHQNPFRGAGGGPPGAAGSPWMLILILAVILAMLFQMVTGSNGSSSTPILLVVPNVQSSAS
jgi:hypothetical protein